MAGNRVLRTTAVAAGAVGGLLSVAYGLFSQQSRQARLTIGEPEAPPTDPAPTLMSRAYIIYILMFVVLIGGLAVILDLGSAMRAPDDLSGDWTLVWRCMKLGHVLGDIRFLQSRPDVASRTRLGGAATRFSTVEARGR